jgi:predicted DNA-binding protein
MKTTIDLPDDLLERSKITAAKRRTSFKKLVIEGLEKVISSEENNPSSKSALERLKRGYQLGNNPLSREDIHAR